MKPILIGSKPEGDQEQRPCRFCETPVAISPESKEQIQQHGATDFEACCIECFYEHDLMSQASLVPPSKATLDAVEKTTGKKLTPEEVMEKVKSGEFLAMERTAQLAEFMELLPGIERRVVERMSKIQEMHKRIVDRLETSAEKADLSAMFTLATTLLLMRQLIGGMPESDLHTVLRELLNETDPRRN